MIDQNAGDQELQETCDQELATTLYQEEQDEVLLLLSKQRAEESLETPKAKLKIEAQCRQSRSQSRVHDA